MEVTGCYTLTYTFTHNFQRVLLTCHENYDEGFLSI